jgi:hypothetical protein
MRMSTKNCPEAGVEIHALEVLVALPLPSGEDSGRVEEALVS